jgi:TPR repeat protein
VPQDYQQAMFWYQKGAEGGDPQSVNNIGALYEGGHGVRANRNTAIEWYRKAAALGNDKAKENLKRLGASQ